MKPVYSARQIEEMLARGETPPAGALLTPSAQDILAEYGKKAPRRGKAAANATASVASTEGPIVPNHEFVWKPGGDPQGPAAIEKFFHSPEITALKERIVDIGRRIWSKSYVDGNGGNITVRVGDNLALCTPTLISKGFMSVDDICLVDLDGNQLAGYRKRTSEVNTHFGIMKRQPKAKACVHAHPPHATAFAVASVEPPTCLIPEAEVFLGKVVLAPYETPGSAENARVVGEAGEKNQAVLMQNHGVIVWGKDVEDAYWKMENVDAYCQTVWIASQLGHGLHRFGPDKLKELIDLRQSLGMEDARAELKECELCDMNTEFRPGVVCNALGKPEGCDCGGDTAKCACEGPCPCKEADALQARYAEAEAVVAQITDRIMERMGA